MKANYHLSIQKAEAAKYMYTFVIKKYATNSELYPKN